MSLTLWTALIATAIENALVCYGAAMASFLNRDIPEGCLLILKGSGWPSPLAHPLQ
jgi:hypothetical protein